MKIYVASSWRNEQYPKVIEQLAVAGHEVFDFRNPSMGPNNGGHGFHWSEVDPDWEDWGPKKFRDALGLSIPADAFLTDFGAMKWADAFVLVMPCGRSAHLELGWAIGAGKKSVILLSDGEPELMYGLADALCVDINEVLKSLS